MRLWKAFFLSVACLSLRDVRNEACRVLCVRSGYDSGQVSSRNLDKCFCVDVKNYKEFQTNSITIGVPIPSPQEIEKGLVAPFRQDSYFYRNSRIDDDPDEAD